MGHVTLVIVRPSSIAGKGIFATRAIRRGEVILRVEGPTIHYPFEPDYRVGPHRLQIGPNTWKVPMHGNPWRYVNHSCEPNAGLRGRTNVVAMRDIRRGEEVTIDYSITEAGRHWRMNCRCGSRQCRHVIRSIQFLPRELFHKYEPYIPLYLQKAYWAEKTYSMFRNGKRRLYAKHPLRQNERVFTVEGPVVRYHFPPNYRIGYIWLATGVNQWIIPLRSAIWCAIQHSCNPNVGVVKKNVVVAMRNIHQDEELTVDDSTIEVDPRWKWQCHCGTRNCRGVVRSVQYLPPALLKKYKPYLSSFIQHAAQRSL